MFPNGLCVSALPTRQSSFPDRKSLQGLSPHRRWPFNTSLATANEPGVAAARLDPADFAQMFISRSPAVLGREAHSNLGSIFTLFIYFHLCAAKELTRWIRLGGFFWRGCAVATPPFQFPRTLLNGKVPEDTCAARAGTPPSLTSCFAPFRFPLRGRGTGWFLVLWFISSRPPRPNLQQPYLPCQAVLAFWCLSSSIGDKTDKADLTS